MENRTVLVAETGILEYRWGQGDPNRIHLARKADGNISRKSDWVGQEVNKQRLEFVEQTAVYTAAIESNESSGGIDKRQSSDISQLHCTRVRFSPPVTFRKCSEAPKIYVTRGNKRSRP
jgi:hypothetical protein